MGIISIALLVLLLPFALLGDLFKLARRWRAVPLQQKNLTRATGGAFALVACAVLAAHGFPVVGWKLTAGIAAFAALYLFAGTRRTHSTVDIMQAFWWAVLALAGIAALAFTGGLPL
jgi:hypothetical protein